MAHDIFVSYARSDDEIPAASAAGWVTTFVTELSKVLRRRIGGAGADVWMDQQLASNERVSQTLREKAASSRTLVLFLSNGYLSSPWCRDELNDFLKANGAHKNRESVFVVEIDRIDRERWPSRLRELTPICLYEVDRQNQIPQLLGFPSPPLDARSPYWSRLNTLAHLIYEHLNRLQESPRIPFRAAASERVGTVWVAAPAPALVEYWESLVGALRQAGAEVRPLGHASYSMGDVPAFRAQVDQDLANAALWVQMFGAEPGPPIAPGAQSSCHVQSLLAKVSQATGMGSRFLQWRLPEIQLETLRDPEHRRALEGTTACGFESFRKTVLDAYAEGLQGRHAAISGGESADRPLQLCVTAGPTDTPHAYAICEIVEALGHNAIAASASPAQGQSPTAFRTQFEEMLATVDGAILVNGSVAPSWIESRYAQLLKLAGGRCPWGALLEAPGSRGSPRVFGPAHFDQLDCRGGISRPPIEHFVKRLTEVRAHG